MQRHGDRMAPSTSSMIDVVPVPVSVVILTLQEEANIVPCIRSCRGLGDVHVLDSGSTDRTAELAAAEGAKVWRNPFTSFGAQRNWAIDHIACNHDWILHLDADERVTPALLAEVRDVLAGEPGHAGFNVPSKLMFMGRWLRRCGQYPTYQVRLFHRRRLRFCDHGHGQREATDGTIGTLREPYEHWAFSKGLDDWIAKHNRYSSLEAAQILSDVSPLRLLDALVGDRVTRRRQLKRIAARLPRRDWLRAFQMLVLHGGVLDGPAGWRYAGLMCLYERMIALKVADARARPGTLP